MNKLIQYVIIIVIIIKVESEKIISNLIRFVNLSAKTVVNIGEPQRLFFFDMDLTRNTSLMISPFYNKKSFFTSWYYLKNPFIISSSASFSVKPNVISLVNCSPAIFPIAASCIRFASTLFADISGIA